MSPAPAVDLDSLTDAELDAHFRAEIRARTAAPFVLPVGPVRKGHPLRDRGVRFVGGVSS